MGVSDKWEPTSTNINCWSVAPPASGVRNCWTICQQAICLLLLVRNAALSHGALYVKMWGGNRNPMLCDHVTQETCNFWSVPQIKKPNAMKYRRKGVQFTPFWMRAAICEIVSKYGASWRIMAHL